MTPKQQSYYLALWHQVAEVQGWAALPKKEQDAKRYAVNALAALSPANKSAAAQGKEVSSKKLTNPEVTEVIRILKRLIEGAHMTDIAHTRNVLPDQQNRTMEICVAINRLAIQMIILHDDHFLSSYSQNQIRERAANYIKSMASDIYGTDDWRLLPIDGHKGANLRHLQLTLKTRMRRRYHWLRTERDNSSFVPQLSLGAEAFCVHIIKSGPVFFRLRDCPEPTPQSLEKTCV